MKQHSLKKTELVSFVIASALGVLFHFMYEWTGENHSGKKTLKTDTGLRPLFSVNVFSI